MAQASALRQTVILECDARLQNVPVAVYVCGNQPEIGSWTPNSVQMRDDGKEGDAVASDGIWTIKTELPVGVEIQYKYTNSGSSGVWNPGEEFPSRHRTRTFDKQNEPLIIRDTFGQ